MEDWLTLEDSLTMNLERDETDRNDYNKPAAGSDAAPDHEEADGFLWGGGDRRMTVGIWAWSKPFYLTLPSGKGDGKRTRTAVLVLDTQGMFDRKTSEHVTRSVFGLGTLLSSSMVYNIKGNISEDVLRTLSMFTEYARVVSKREQKHNASVAAPDSPSSSAAEAAAPESEDSKAPFQHVTVLVRDSAKAERRGPLEEGQEDAYAAECDRVMDQIMKEGGAGGEEKEEEEEAVLGKGKDGIKDIRGTREQI